MISTDILQYCDNCGLLQGAEIFPMTPDCSSKKHYRARVRDKSYVILDSASDFGVADSFIKVSNFLNYNDFSAPRIFDYDQERQIVLTEDFGENSYSSILRQSSSDEFELYRLAIEVLIRMMGISVSIDLPQYSFQELNRALLNSFIKFYVSDYVSEDLIEVASNDFIILFNNLYAPLCNIKHSLVLRDYHVDNLMLLEHRIGYRKVGLLDIQDAAFGLPAYDLVSLLEDARRDVNPDLVVDLKKMFVYSIPDYERDAFVYSYTVLGMQRSLRILGLFHYISKQPGKERYSSFLPRVSRYIKQHLTDNMFRGLLLWSDKYKIPLND